MLKRLRYFLLFGALATVGVSVAIFHPQAEEVEESETPSVSESDVDLYIRVYTAMQENHDLTIDNALASRQMSLDDFRQLERRIQSQPRLVERVRQALLDSAKAHSVFAQALASPTPGRTPAERKPRHRKKP